MYIYIYTVYVYIYIEAYPLAFLNSLLPRISPAPMLPLRPVASTLWTKKLPRMDSQPSQSMQWTSYLLKSYQENHSQSGIRHPSKSFASSSIHQTHVPELVDACGFFNKARLLEGTWGNFSLEFPDPPKQLRPARTSPAKTSKGLPFPIVMSGKNLERKKSGRKKSASSSKAAPVFFPKNNRNNMTRLWRFKNRNGGLVNDKMVFDLTSIPGGGVIARELSVCLRLVTKATPPQKKNGVDSSYGGFPKMVVPNNHGFSY